MGQTLEDELKIIRGEESKILEKIKERDGRKRIKCESCDKSHAIKNLTLIQTHWYTRPSGCTDGDYWNDGEMQFVCPDTKVANRMLFNNNEIPWEDRKEYKNDPEAQFQVNYKELFKEIMDKHDSHGLYGEDKYSMNGQDIKREDVTNGDSVNNFYVDKNRKKFGLIEKKK